MTIALGIIAAIAVIVAAWALATRVVSSAASADAMRKIVADFDAKKKAESQRIDEESKNALVDDFNSHK